MFMKKSALLIALLAVALVLTGCGNPDYYLLSEYNWTMLTVQRDVNGTFAAYADGTEGIDTTTGAYKDAAALTLTLSATSTEIPEDEKNGEFDLRVDQGTFVIENTQTGETWEGTFDMANATSDASYYNVYIGEETGAATLKILTAEDQTQSALLIFEMGGYTIRWAG